MRHAFLVCLLTASTWAQDPVIELTRIAGGFNRVTDIQQPDDHSGRLFVAEQTGRIRIVRNGASVSTPFLDISSLTRVTGIGDERGLLGVAFPPGFVRKQHFYVCYTDARGTSVVSRYGVSPSNRDVAEPGSAQIILSQSQPFSNHNGGQIAFGPDGYLYIGFGDGGSARDPQGNGQNRQTWLGKILRIDVESDAAQYFVPPSNPFARDPSALPEIWSLGWRNPWRFSFDRMTGDMWIADVGQNRAEEIDFQPASSRGGENYGWSTLEGFQCLTSPTCNKTGVTMPVLEYDSRSRGDVSVTGGYVYRGTRSPSLNGMYIYGDYGSGRLWGLRREGVRFSNQLLRGPGFPVSTFGQDQSGEVYVADYSGGVIYRLDAAAAPAPSFTAASVVNAASGSGGLVAGSLGTLYATGLREEGISVADGLPLPLEIDSVSVVINGQPAPLYAVAHAGGNEQVNFQTPFETSGPLASVVVRRGPSASAPVEVPVFPHQPGVFTSNGTDAISWRTGDFLSFYATGLGALDNQPATGVGAPSSPLARVTVVPRITIAGVECEVQFAGLAPGLVGVYQVNVRLTAAVPSGSQEMLVTSAGVASQPVRITVR